MKDRDDRLLEEAYSEISEGWLKRSDAKTGTRMKSLGAKALGSAGKVLGSKLGAKATNQANQMRGEVDKQRLQQLMGSYQGQLEKLKNQITTDITKMGGDVANIQEQDPDFPGVKYLLNALDQAVQAGATLQGGVQGQQTGQMAPQQQEAPQEAPQEEAPVA